MKRPLHIIKRFAVTTVLAVIAVTLTSAQEAIVVAEGEVFNLGVVPVPGDTYVWNIYTDHTLETEALPQDVAFVSGNSGAVVPVLWSRTGTFYYTVTAFNPSGCMNLKAGMIRVDELKQTPSISIWANRNPICEGEYVTFTAGVFNPGTDPVYQWYKNNVRIGGNLLNYIDCFLKNNDVVRCELTNTTMKSGPMTVSSNEITISVHLIIASFTITENVGNEKGRTRFDNKSIGAEFYHWDFGNGYTSNEEDPVITYTDDGTYMIRLISANSINCTDTCKHPFELLFRSLFIPNAFAPTVTNGPGGHFKPVGVNLKKYRIEVYDSWGHLIWESTKLDSRGRPTEGWDGIYNGELMPQGTYMWKVHAVFVDGTIWQGSDIGIGKGKTIGTVTLLK
ncbi:MAG: gliding motility-associated C-terminal domain-containing protein [Bacteroidia bacterium]|nr:gliding motility-associated C-terminal domain-containing protein [Bacteroidia bacterium]